MEHRTNPTISPNSLCWSTDSLCAPALATRMSTLPNCSTVQETRRSTSHFLVTSHFAAPALMSAPSSCCTALRVQAGRMFSKPGTQPLFRTQIETPGSTAGSHPAENSLPQTARYCTWACWTQHSASCHTNLGPDSQRHLLLRLAAQQAHLAALCSSMSAITTLQPSWPKHIAQASPIPLPPPASRAHTDLQCPKTPPPPATSALAAPQWHVPGHLPCSMQTCTHL